ncbi:MAG: hypothetical protein ACQEVA_07955 [Myxococcota bacterium]
MERSAVVFLAVISMFALACGFLNEDGDVTFTPGIPVEFTVDANELCPEGQDCSEEQTAAPMDQELAEIETDVDVDVVEQTGNEKLSQYAGNFKSIEIVAIEYEVKNNDLTFDLPESDLYIGPIPAETTEDEGVAKLATIPTVAAGTNPSGTAEVAQAGREVSSEQLKQLKLSAILQATPVVKEGQPFPPSGSADVKLTIKVKFVANPIE